MPMRVNRFILVIYLSHRIKQGREFRYTFLNLNLSLAFVLKIFLTRSELKRKISLKNLEHSGFVVLKLVAGSREYDWLRLSEFFFLSFDCNFVINNSLTWKLFVLWWHLIIPTTLKICIVFASSLIWVFFREQSSQAKCSFTLYNCCCRKGSKCHFELSQTKVHIKVFRDKIRGASIELFTSSANSI